MKRFAGALYRIKIVAGTSALLAIDAITKWLAIIHLKDQQPLVLIDRVLELQYAPNTGVSFSMLSDYPVFIAVVTGVILLCLSALLLSGKFRGQGLLSIGGTFIIAGGLGNLLERVLRPDHGVTDFVYISLINFPIFNFADCCIVGGAVIVLIFFFFFYKEPKKGKRQNGRWHPIKHVSELEPLPGSGDTEDKG